MNHQPWDNGSIDAAFTQVLGVSAREITKQKTVKARCGKRVAVSLAVAGQPVTCFGCRESINREKEFVLEQAVALNHRPILFSIADQTLSHAHNSVLDDAEAAEIILQAWEAVIAEDLAAGSSEFSHEL